MTSNMRRFFKIERIYQSWTTQELFALYGIGFIVLDLSTYGTIDATASNAIRAAHQVLFTIVWVLFLYSFARSCLRLHIINKRLSPAQYQSTDNSVDPEVRGSVIRMQYQAADHYSQRRLRSGQGWKLFDVVFDFYTQSHNARDHTIRQAFYTVFDGKLARRLPHILFDSRLARGRQFKYIYAHSQRVSLEGGFDQHFDTYVPQTYKIDSLSFITPELMEILLEAKAYDIEIVDDRLMLLAPLTDVADLEALQILGLKLVAALNDNVVAYKDDRLVGTARSSDVTPFARALIVSPLRAIFGILIIGGFIGMSIVTSIISDDIVGYIVPILALTGCLVAAVFYNFKLQRANKLAIRQAELDDQNQKPRL